MTPREFRQLHAIPFDIKARTRRIQQLEAKQAEGPEPVSYTHLTLPTNSRV